mmetsp:Transcript_19934/g.36845  ORF Transcript_19934/g.36845 Transcript_19934/m.36845 type:complete len:221 (-) Transcript_19934:1327-1989(-)
MKSQMVTLSSALATASSLSSLGFQAIEVMLSLCHCTLTASDRLRKSQILKRLSSPPEASWNSCFGFQEITFTSPLCAKLIVCCESPSIVRVSQNLIDLSQLHEAKAKSWFGQACMSSIADLWPRRVPDCAHPESVGSRMNSPFPPAYSRPYFPHSKAYPSSLKLKVPSSCFAAFFPPLNCSSCPAMSKIWTVPFSLHVATLLASSHSLILLTAPRWRKLT